MDESKFKVEPWVDESKFKVEPWVDESKFKFEPWEDAEKIYKEHCSLDIPEPPCKHCKHWNPRIKTLSNGIYDGIVLCTSEEMYQDFSCFELRQEKGIGK